MKKYTVLAGSGKTSYDLDAILAAAFDGRVESIFIPEEKHIWGDYDHDKRKATIHPEKQEDDICLLSLAAVKTVENNGNAYLVKENEIPEKETKTPLTAVFRY